jgi:hypothetical protein
MESNIIPEEIADHGDNFLGCSLKSKPAKAQFNFRADLFKEAPAGKSFSKANRPNIRQYMTEKNLCEKVVNKTEPFPSLLVSAEQERREKRNLDFIRRSICEAVEPES